MNMRRQLRRQRRRLHVLLLLKEVYKNWPFLWFCELSGHRPTKLRLRSSDLKIVGALGLSMTNVLALARLLKAKWQIKEVGEHHLILEDARALTKIKCRTDAGLDIKLMAEVFVERVYDTDFEGKTVVDVGVYNGDSAVYFARNGAARVIGLEPFRESLDLAMENINQLNDLGKVITVVQAALFSREGIQDFIIHPNSPNLNSIADRSGGTGILSKVRTVTLNSLMRDYGLDRIDVLKLNCEGCEYDIIGSLSENIARSIDEIHIEFHRGSEKLVAKLEQFGYAIQGKGMAKLGHIRATRARRTAVIAS